jgi:hypothetical protein
MTEALTPGLLGLLAGCMVLALCCMFWSDRDDN